MNVGYNERFFPKSMISDSFLKSTTIPHFRLKIKVTLFFTSCSCDQTSAEKESYINSPLPSTKKKMAKSKKKDQQEEQQEQEQAEGGVKAPIRKKRVSKKGKHEKFSSYLRTLTKEIHPTTGLMKEGVNVMNDILYHFVDDLTMQASQLVMQNAKKTLEPPVIKAALMVMIDDVDTFISLSNAGDAAIKKYEASRVSDQ